MEKVGDTEADAQVDAEADEKETRSRRWFGHG